MSARRWPCKPDIPTLSEQGYGKHGGQSWYGLLAIAGTAEPIVSRTAGTIDQALASPDILDELDKAGAMATYLDAAAMRAELDLESRMCADIIRRANIKAE